MAAPRRWPISVISQGTNTSPMRWATRRCGRLIHGLMTEEVMPTLPMPRADLETYRDALLARFANPALKHRTWQIAMDGSQKPPQRLLGTIRDRPKAGEGGPGFTCLALGVAARMRYVTGIDESGQPIEVKGPDGAAPARHRRRRRRQRRAAGGGLFEVSEISAPTCRATQCSPRRWPRTWQRCSRMGRRRPWREGGG